MRSSDADGRSFYVQFRINENNKVPCIYRCRFPTFINGLDKHYLSTLTRSTNIFKNCVNVMNKNIDFIHGPTADEVTQDIDLSGKICLITGTNSGLGLEMTRCLHSRNCTVLMACRNAYAANVVAKCVTGDPDRLRLYEINLASLRSVNKCTDLILRNEKKIDKVILNAGVFGLPWTLTEDMLETTFQVNYLSQFYFLMNIEKILSPDARVVFISAESHRHVNMDFNDKLRPTEEVVSLPEHKYTSIKAYNISKLCGILSMHYLGYRWLNTKKSVFCAHPGSFIKTRLCRNWWPYEMLYTVMKPFAKSISQAASTPIYCATSPDLAGLSDVYYKDCKRCEESELARDLHLSFRLYDLTLDIINQRVSATEEGKRVEKPVISDDQTKDSVDGGLIPNY